MDITVDFNEFVNLFYMRIFADICLIRTRSLLV